ncbi:MAG: DUF4202 domain-containing protein [Acidobacteriota bacterium]
MVEIASQWILEKYKHNSLHLINSLEWLDRIAPGSGEHVRLATVTHDMERAFPGPDMPVWSGWEDHDYYVAHSNRSARIVGEWLRARGAGDPLVKQVEELIKVHEFGGWPEADLVQAADSLSFLDVNVDLFLNYVRTGKFTAEQVRAKFLYSHTRVRLDRVKELTRPMLERANARLEEVEATYRGSTTIP